MKIKEIIDNILLAEQRAEGIEKDASKRAQDIRVEMHAKAEEYIESVRKETDGAVRQIMLKASADGEAEAAELIKKSGASYAHEMKAAEKRIDKAVERIVQEFYEKL